MRITGDVSTSVIFGLMISSGCGGEETSPGRSGGREATAGGAAAGYPSYFSVQGGRAQTNSGTHSGINLAIIGGANAIGGDSGSQSSPVAGGASGVRHRIVVGDNVACAIGENSEVVCWRIENGSTASHTALRGVYRSLAIGPSTSMQAVCGLDDQGHVSCADWDGSVGGQTKMVLTDCLPTDPVLAFTIDRKLPGAFAFIDSSGGIKSFPLSGICQNYAAPTAVGSATHIVLAQSHACAIMSDRSVACWNTARSDVLEPTLNDSFVDVATGPSEACALNQSGKVRCWDNTGSEDFTKTHFAAKLAGETNITLALASDNTGTNLCGLVQGGRPI